jgi:hypothetical protein
MGLTGTMWPMCHNTSICHYSLSFAHVCASWWSWRVRNSAGDTVLIQVCCYLYLCTAVFNFLHTSGSTFRWYLRSVRWHYYVRTNRSKRPRLTDVLIIATPSFLQNPPESSCSASLDPPYPPRTLCIIRKSTWNWYDQIELTNKTLYDTSIFRLTYYYLCTTNW